jgi:hypothetical protein
VFKNVGKNSFNDLPNGILYLKGMEAGDVFNNRTGEQTIRRTGEQAKWRADDQSNRRTGDVVGGRRIEYRNYPLSDYFSAPFFETKAVVHLF